MSSFKISKKAAHTDSRMSIIAKHEQTLDNIEKDRKNIDKYKSELNLLYKARNINKFNKEIEDKITVLEKKIENITTGADLSDYLFKSIEFIKDIDKEDYLNVTNTDGEIFKYISLDSQNNKEETYKMYMSKCFPNECKSYSKPKIDEYICKECKASMIKDIANGTLVCYSCGATQNFNISDLLIF